MSVESMDSSAQLPAVTESTIDVVGPGGVVTTSSEPVTRVRKLLVNEIFGPTVQGEGPSSGTPCVFVRLSSCNLHCRWCDTPYTWAFTERQVKQHDKTTKPYMPQRETHPMTQAEVVVQVTRRMPGGGLIVISGGEPLLQKESLVALLDYLAPMGYWFEIETAGTRSPGPLASPIWPISWNVSPKLEHSGNTVIERYHPQVLRQFNDLGANFKFVASMAGHLDEVEAIVKDCDLDQTRVWIMPEGTTVEETIENARKIVNGVIRRRWKLTMRTHTLLWGDQRGR